MRESLLEVLRSPRTGSVLTLEVWETGPLGTGAEQILAGLLCDRDGHTFPIIRGVPRLLTGALLAATFQQEPAFHTRYRDRLADCPVAAAGDGLKQATLRSFGQQWQTFSHMLPVWRASLEDYLAPLLTLADFAGASVLDGGCGFGRHLFHVAASGARLAVGVDLSPAVNAAAVNVAGLPNAHVVQADLEALPLAPAFDLVYAIGVLQHLPDPGRGFVRLSEAARPGGRVFAWVYGPRPRSYHAVVDGLRRITVGMPHRALFVFTFLLALLSFGLLALPRRLFDALGLSALGAKIPYSRYAQYPFAVSHADWYDRLAAPRTVYLRESDVHAMLRQAGLMDAQVVPRAGGSWRLLGRVQG